MKNDGTLHQGNIQECKAIFVTWVWVAILLSGSIGTAGVVAWNFSHDFTFIHNKLDIHETRISTLEKTQTDIDSIKTWVRPKR